ncbi:hypothetical protein HETIRDRAFT_102678 [Heterobasidion irregulare TC 32-1]|uniref:Uncharacterized protein n=1 Tax=Heterobasidion irregulare (strain TC 32-1) TaxID=747525 RepID=W4KFF9_HETIT|nr:uncharacterized protein HETIRDRAFT_102678 [Heterobasidion irregulare TC 32-1]ETW84050.1 hypothetical protein HETIRDRAFT_102678 [Heterobasidion irregulare TC 32-1]
MMKVEHVRLFPHYKYRSRRRPKPEIGALPQSTAVDFPIRTHLGPVHRSSEASRKKHEQPQQHPYKRPKLQGASANLESLDPPSFPVAEKISPVASGSTQLAFPPVAMNPENVFSPPMPPAYPPPRPHAYSPHLSNDAALDHLPSDAFSFSPTDGLSTRIYPPSSLFDSSFDMRAYPSDVPSNDSYAHPTIPPESFSYPSQPQPTPTILPGQPMPAYAAWGFPSQEKFDDWRRQSVSHYPR